jgi:hypothetical protein
LYQPAQDPPPIYPARPGTKPTTIPEGEDEDAYPTEGEFAYENDLRDYLARNLGSLERGLRVYEDEGISGIEFPVGGRFIDILATDSSGGPLS